MSTYGGGATIINRMCLQRHALLLIVLVCLSLAACGAAQAPNAATAVESHRTTSPTIASSPIATITTVPTPIATVTAEQVLGLAQTGLLRFREAYRARQADPAGKCSQPAYIELGFKDQQELDHASLGPPYQEFLLEPELLKRSTPGTPVATLITPRPYWLVPIVSGSEGRSAINVGLESGTLQEVGYGGQQNLSRNLMTVHNKYTSTSIKLTLIKFTVADAMLLTEGSHESLVILNAPEFVAQDVRHGL